MADLVTRRKFIQKYAYAGTVFIGGALLFGCGSSSTPKSEEVNLTPPPEPTPTPAPDTVKAPAPKDTVKAKGEEAPEKNVAKTEKPKQEAKPKATDPCDDMTGVSPEELEKRRKMAYVSQSPIPDSQCGNCALHLVGAAAHGCGGCVLFKGPVRDGGYCAYWAPANG